MRKIFNKRVILIVSIIIAIVFMIIYFALNNIPKPVVTSSTPSDQSDSVLQTSKIDIMFSNLVDKNTSNIAIKTNPDIQSDFAWLPNQLRILPKSNLQTNTKYSITVFYKNKQIYIFSFTTIPYTQEQLKTDGLQQMRADLEFGNAYKGFATQYPWYSSLPIETNAYRIVYDFQTNSFRIRILTADGNNQQDSITQNALKNLKEIGVKEPIKYYLLQF